ncbi:endonuclease III [Candidatus Woesearchaeota archaeon]|nr:endonuclease III [Candidatus Woesearchaeota archaeon]
MVASPENVLQLLHKEHPHITHYLHFSNPLELMVATILSAQIRDDVVNAATTNLFAQYKTAKDYANAETNDIVPIIKNITYANTKAKHIVEACQILVKKHQGQVPKTMTELVELPGIGRKSANAILQNAFGIVEGIVVDTHVLRVCYRFGWTTSNTNAVKSERELMGIVPHNEWKNIPGLMKRHGRALCTPVPKCKECFLNQLCPKKGV